MIAPCLGAVARLGRGGTLATGRDRGAEIGNRRGYHALADIAAIVCGAGEKRALTCARASGSRRTPTKPFCVLERPCDARRCRQYAPR